MPVAMGILCEHCRTVYFIRPTGKSAHIQFDRRRRDFRLACNAPCKTVTYFHRTMLKPYAVSTEALERGYAEVCDCKPISVE